MQATICRTLKKIGQQEIVSSDGPMAEERTFSLRTAPKKAASQWLGCGGDRRLLLVAPEGLSPPQLAEQLGPDVGQPPTVVVDEDSDVLLCCEMERLPWAAWQPPCSMAASTTSKSRLAYCTPGSTCSGCHCRRRSREVGRHLLCEVPDVPFRQRVPVPFPAHDASYLVYASAPFFCPFLYLLSARLNEGPQQFRDCPQMPGGGQKVDRTARNAIPSR